MESQCNFDFNALNTQRYCTFSYSYWPFVLILFSVHFEDLLFWVYFVTFVLLILSELILYQTFSHSAGFLFTLSVVSSVVQKILMWCNHISWFFILFPGLLECSSGSHWWWQYLKDLFYISSIILKVLCLVVGSYIHLEFYKGWNIENKHSFQGIVD